MTTKTINLNLPAISADGGLTSYLSEIKKFPILSPEEEYEESLFDIAGETPFEKARQQLVEAQAAATTGGETTGGGSDSPVSLSLSNITDSSFDVWMDNTEDVAGFQIELEGSTISGAAGGFAEAAGFMISNSESMVLGFSVTGDVLPPSTGNLITLTFASYNGYACFSDNTTFSDAGAGALSLTLGSCLGDEPVSGCTDSSACNYDSSATDAGDCTYASGCETCNDSGGVDSNDSDCDCVCDGDEVVGVAIIGRPVSRNLDNGYTAEVTRVCVLDGYRNGCSKLYGACWRAARAMGYQKMVTYTLKTEPGTSLKASGWDVMAETRGGSWNCEARPRVDKHPLQGKLRWEVAV